MKQFSLLPHTEKGVSAQCFTLEEGASLSGQIISIDILTGLFTHVVNKRERGRKSRNKP